MTKRHGEPQRYKIICVSMYRGDLDELDRRVDALKDRGWTHISRSKLIRIALKRLDIAMFVTRAEFDALAARIHAEISGITVAYARPFDTGAEHSIAIDAYGRRIGVYWREGDCDLRVTLEADLAADAVTDRMRVPTTAMAFDTVAGLLAHIAALTPRHAQPELEAGATP